MDTVEWPKLDFTPTGFKAGEMIMFGGFEKVYGCSVFTVLKSREAHTSFQAVFMYEDDSSLLVEE